MQSRQSHCTLLGLERGILKDADALCANHLKGLQKGFVIWKTACELYDLASVGLR